MKLDRNSKILRRIAYLDISNLNARVPIYQNNIYMKVLTLPKGILSQQ